MNRVNNIPTEHFHQKMAFKWHFVVIKNFHGNTLISRKFNFEKKKRRHFVSFESSSTSTAVNTSFVILQLTLFLKLFYIMQLYNLIEIVS